MPLCRKRPPKLSFEFAAVHPRRRATLEALAQQFAPCNKLRILPDSAPRSRTAHGWYPALIVAQIPNNEPLVAWRSSPTKPRGATGSAPHVTKPSRRSGSASPSFSNGARPGRRCPRDLRRPAEVFHDDTQIEAYVSIFEGAKINDNCDRALSG